MMVRYGASLNTNRSAWSGIRSSLKNSLIPSARVWAMPKGPARLGPIRLCMSEMTLRSNQIINMTDTIRTPKTTSTLTTTMSSTAQPTPFDVEGVAGGEQGVQGGQRAHGVSIRTSTTRRRRVDEVGDGPLGERDVEVGGHHPAGQGRVGHAPRHHGRGCAGAQPHRPPSAATPRSSRSWGLTRSTARLHQAGQGRRPRPPPPPVVEGRATPPAASSSCRPGRHGARPGRRAGQHGRTGRGAGRVRRARRHRSGAPARVGRLGQPGPGRRPLSLDRLHPGDRHGVERGARGPMRDRHWPRAGPTTPSTAPTASSTERVMPR